MHRPSMYSARSTSSHEPAISQYVLLAYAALSIVFVSASLRVGLSSRVLARLLPVTASARNAGSLAESSLRVGRGTRSKSEIAVSRSWLPAADEATQRMRM